MKPLPNEFVVEELHKANQSNPFYIVITGDGFRNTPDNRDYDILRDFAKTLTSRFLRIPPFNYCKDYIHVLLALTPSNVRGITDVRADTAFRFFYRDGIDYDITDETYVIDKLKRIPFPQDLSVPSGLNKSSEDIWFNPMSKSFGAVCIVLYSYEPGGLNKIARDPEALTFIAARNSVPFMTYTPTWRFFVQTMNGYFNDENLADDGYGQPIKLGGNFLHTFAHLLGYSLRLFPEYEIYEEGPSSNFIDKVKTSSNLSYVNYSRSGNGEASGEEILNQISWSWLMTQSEKDLIKSKTHVWTKARIDPFTDDEKTKVIDNEIYRGFPGTTSATHWIQMMVVEGGWTNLNLSRSNFECKMRHHIFSDDTGEPGDTIACKINIEGTEEYGSPPFCRLCNYTIRNRITGWKEFGIGTPLRSKFDSLFYDELMPRLRLSFDFENSARTLTGGAMLTTNGSFCHVAAPRVYVMLQQLGYDVGFMLNKEHVTAFYKGLYLDPVFYAWYAVLFLAPENARFEYTKRDNSLGAYSIEKSEKGFIGDLQQIENQFYGFTPSSNTLAFGIWEGMPTLGITWAENVDYLYKGEYWKGPIRDLTLEGIDLPVSDYIETFLTSIISFWSNWLEYWKTRKDDTPRKLYFKPLNMSIKLSDLVGGGN